MKKLKSRPWHTADDMLVGRQLHFGMLYLLHPFVRNSLHKDDSFGRLRGVSFWVSERLAMFTLPIIPCQRAPRITVQVLSSPLSVTP